MALVGLGLGLGQKGWGHGPYRWVKVQGPSRPGDPYAIQLYLNFFFFLVKRIMH